jgi:hypothetical protein
LTTKAETLKRCVLDLVGVRCMGRYDNQNLIDAHGYWCDEPAVIVRDRGGDWFPFCSQHDIGYGESIDVGALVSARLASPKYDPSPPGMRPSSPRGSYARSFAKGNGA